MIRMWHIQAWNGTHWINIDQYPNRLDADRALNELSQNGRYGAYRVVG